MLRGIFCTALIWAKTVVTTIAVIAGLWLAVQHIFHLQLLDVQTGSMVPVFSPGDALILQKQLPDQLKVGQIVSYHSARNPRELVTHRVVAITADGFQTKGDQLSRADPPVRSSLFSGKVIAILPSLGRVLAWFRSLPGLISCVYAPAIMIAAYELRRLEQHYRSLEPYRLRSRQVV
jgi:signal peptidase I